MFNGLLSWFRPKKSDADDSGDCGMQFAIPTPEFLSRPYEAAEYPTTLDVDMILIGSGGIYFDKTERQSDRYGLIGVFAETGSDDLKDGFDRAVVESFDNATGTLYVRITEAHEPTHIGDCFHNIRPRVAQAGDVIELGRGEIVWCDDFLGKLHVGVRPKDGREYFWMSPQALYDCYCQGGEVYFKPDRQ